MAKKWLKLTALPLLVMALFIFLLAGPLLNASFGVTVVLVIGLAFSAFVVGLISGSVDL
jgi:hypothetical protein